MLGYLCLVFLIPVMFVSADVIHQVPLFILVFIAIFSVLQEVKRLQNVTWASVQISQEVSNRVEPFKLTGDIEGVSAAPLAVFTTFCSIDQMLQVLILHGSVLLGRRQAE